MSWLAIDGDPEFASILIRSAFKYSSLSIKYFYV
jgi:hypothetical protein